MCNTATHTQRQQFSRKHTDLSNNRGTLRAYFTVAILAVAGDAPAAYNNSCQKMSSLNH